MINVIWSSMYTYIAWWEHQLIKPNYTVQVDVQWAIVKPLPIPLHPFNSKHVKMDNKFITFPAWHKYTGNPLFITLHCICLWYQRWSAYLHTNCGVSEALIMPDCNNVWGWKVKIHVNFSIRPSKICCLYLKLGCQEDQANLQWCGCLVDLTSAIRQLAIETKTFDFWEFHLCQRTG